MVNAMSTDPNIVYFSEPGKSAASGADGGVSRPLHDLQDQFVRRVTDLFASMLDNTDDALFALADKAENNSVQSMYFDSMREVRLKRSEIESRFRAEVLDGFRALRREQAPAPGAADGSDADWSSEELSLVGHDDLEESLAVDGMVGKARSRHAQAIEHLRARLVHMMPGVRLDEDTNPTDPKRVCAAFRRAAQALELEVRAKLVVYKLFDKSVMESLGDLYTHLNHMLINAGVLPHIKLKVPGVRSPRSRRPGPAVQAGAGGTGPTGDEEVEVFGTLQELLADHRGIGASGGGGGGGAGTAAVYAAHDVLEALNLLQSGGHQLPLPAAEGRVLEAAELRTALGGALAQVPGVGPGKQLGRGDEDVIDIVSMLFDFILDDAALPDRIKAVLARLQIPMLKVAMLDRSFFGSRQHPARQLLNELAQSAANAGNDAGAEAEALYRHAAAAVERILQEFEDDVAVFAEVLEEFRCAVAPAPVAPDDAEAEDEAAAEPGDPVATARERARAAVAERLRDRRLPDAVAAMLSDAWVEVLTEIGLEDDAAAPGAWERGVEVVDRVLWSIEPKSGFEERKRLIDAIPALLRDLRQGLARVSVPSRRLSAYFQALQELHIECIKEPDPLGRAPVTEVASSVQVRRAGSDAAAEAQPQPAPHDLAAEPAVAAPESEPESAQTPAAAPEPDDLSEPPADPEDAVEEIVLVGEPDADAGADAAEDDEHLARLRAVAVGTWFEFDAPDGGRQRAKLSARLERAGKFVFVNRAGFKVAEKTLHGLATEMRRGAAVVVDDGLLFDKALEAVISNLRRARG